MSADLDAALSRYIKYFENLSRDNVEQLTEIAAPGLHFRDPFNDVRGVELVVKILRETLEDSIAPKFEITESLRSGSLAFIKWQFTFRPKRAKAGSPWLIEGVSEIRFDAAGRITEHLDYWDAGRQFYERLPLLGSLLRFVRGRLQLQ